MSTPEESSFRMANKKAQAREMHKFTRGTVDIPIKKIKDQKLKGLLRRSEHKIEDAARKAMQSQVFATESAGYLEAEGMEKTYKFTQEAIKKQVDLNTRAKIFDLKLEMLGPYMFDYTRNGKNMLIGGEKGHVATFEWKTGRPGCELQLKETIRDVKLSVFELF